ncbi:MAG: L-serine ammonia-lyase, iron-sulfur-dependent, subunit alpha [Eubacteriales bacterium]|nr:L-serine ammonia-lyase, iron-sulfur-dependent, subunit alpha [Eubacteriales bacterium]
MFNSIQELVALAQDGGVPLWQVMLTQEEEATGRGQDDILEEMAGNYRVMKEAAHAGILGVTTHSGLCGGDARRLYDYLQKGSVLTDSTLLKAVCYAIATNEVNAAMGRVCATPTAGSAGVLPGVMLAMQEKRSLPDSAIVRHLFTAGAVGFVIANRAGISGAAGGCQAEIGSASAMAAAAVTELAGGTPGQAAHAMALALKNMLGLVCDPLAGLVEVPCIKRNAAGAANALVTAEMALAGIESKVPWDEVIEAMRQIGRTMPISFKETAQGGLATTPTGEAWKQLLWS